MRHLFLILSSAFLSCNLIAGELLPKETSCSNTGSIDINGDSQQPLTNPWFIDSTDSENALDFDPNNPFAIRMQDQQSWEHCSNLNRFCGTSTKLSQSLSGRITFVSMGPGISNAVGFQTDSSYAQHLPIRHFFLTEQQMARFFSSLPPQPESLNFYGLSESNLYLIVQIKNTGSRSAYGTLCFDFSHHCHKIFINTEAHMNAFSTYVIPLGLNDGEDFEKISHVNDCLERLKWKCIYVGMTEEEIYDFLEQWVDFSERGHDEDEEEIDDVFEDENDCEEECFPIVRSSEW